MVDKEDIGICTYLEISESYFGEGLYRFYAWERCLLGFEGDLTKEELDRKWKDKECGLPSNVELIENDMSEGAYFELKNSIQNRIDRKEKLEEIQSIVEIFVFPIFLFFVALLLSKKMFSKGSISKGDLYKKVLIVVFICVPVLYFAITTFSLTLSAILIGLVVYKVGKKKRE